LGFTSCCFVLVCFVGVVFVAGCVLVEAVALADCNRNGCLYCSFPEAVCLTQVRENAFKTCTVSLSNSILSSCMVRKMQFLALVCTSVGSDEFCVSRELVHV
jgi:hypothetical protein